jgi:phosphatidylserine synthase
VCSYIIFSYHIWHELRYFNSFLLLAVLAALLMVSTIEYETYPKFTLRTLRSRLLLGLFVTLLVLLFRWPSLLLFVFTWVYILFGIVRWIVLAVRPQSNEDNEEPERPVSFGD